MAALRGSLAKLTLSSPFTHEIAKPTKKHGHVVNVRVSVLDTYRTHQHTCDIFTQTMWCAKQKFPKGENLNAQTKEEDRDERFTIVDHSKA